MVASFWLWVSIFGRVLYWLGCLTFLIGPTWKLNNLAVVGIRLSAFVLQTLMIYWLWLCPLVLVVFRSLVLISVPTTSRRCLLKNLSLCPCSWMSCTACGLDTRSNDGSKAFFPAYLWLAYHIINTLSGKFPDRVCAPCSWMSFTACELDTRSNYSSKVFFNLIISEITRLAETKIEYSSLRSDCLSHM